MISLIVPYVLYPAKMRLITKLHEEAKIIGNILGKSLANFTWSDQKKHLPVPLLFYLSLTTIIAGFLIDFPPLLKFIYRNI